MRFSKRHRQQWSSIFLFFAISKQSKKTSVEAHGTERKLNLDGAESKLASNDQRFTSYSSLKRSI